MIELCVYIILLAYNKHSVNLCLFAEIRKLTMCKYLFVFKMSFTCIHQQMANCCTRSAICFDFCKVTLQNGT